MAGFATFVADQFVQLLTSVYYSSIIFLLAVGLSFVYGFLNFLNLAHASFLTLGAFIAAELIGEVSQTPSFLSVIFPFLAVLVAVPVVVAAAGAVLEYTIFQPVYEMEETFQLLGTFGVVLMLEGLMSFVWAGEAASGAAPVTILGNVNLGGNTFPLYLLFVVFVTVLIGLGLYYFFEQTRLGRITLAMAEDPDIVRTCGIDARSIHMRVLLLSIALAGLSGALWVPNAAVAVGISLEFVILAFAVIVIGGLGSLRGAAVGALLVGLIRTYGLSYFPGVSLALVFLLMALVVLVKPTGIYGGLET